MQCDKCGSPTTPKQITSKKNGQTYTVFECTGSCMNGRYKYSMFAPRAPKQAPYSAPSSQPSGEPLETLREIRDLLKGIYSVIKTNQVLKNDPLEVETRSLEGNTPF